MRIITIDCVNITSETEFWDAYVDAALPDGASFFGRNLDAFWDAVSAGGPGWPGECELRFVNTFQLKYVRQGKFYDSLKKIATDSTFINIDVE
jgi:ribonuclease inhibitor